jgi:hypothetical protein
MGNLRLSKRSLSLNLVRDHCHFENHWLFSSRHGHSTKHQPHFPLPRQSITQSFDLQAKVECVFSILRVSTFQLKSCDRYQPQTKHSSSINVFKLSEHTRCKSQTHNQASLEPPPQENLYEGNPITSPTNFAAVSACFNILLSS